MGRKTNIEKALNDTQLKDCCVLNSFKELRQTADQPYTHEKLAAWSLPGVDKNRRTSVHTGILKNSEMYLETGRELAKNIPWAGICQTFACASSYIIKSCKDFAVNSIELFSFGNKFSGHVFLVIDRPKGSDESNPRTWTDAIIVDEWYALQKGDDDHPAFKANDLGSAYMIWLLAKTGIRCELSVV
ncbi:hypothetical protein [Aliidongia dinghuensis]|uniref:hypothetical protein n=1 Tax=Aliidongia dinghuensis TaxID=1867774 RepID=UPI001663AFEE|nr:hypothetical protein [Aliidongia dinghuensis]